MTTINEIKPEVLQAAAFEIYHDMKNCEASGKAIAQMKLPDGRTAELQVVITAEEENFLLNG